MSADLQGVLAHEFYKNESEKACRQTLEKGLKFTRLQWPGHHCSPAMDHGRPGLDLALDL